MVAFFKMCRDHGPLDFHAPTKHIKNPTPPYFIIFVISIIIVSGQTTYVHRTNPKYHVVTTLNIVSKCHLLFGIMPWCNYLQYISYFSNKSQFGCLGIIEHFYLADNSISSEKIWLCVTPNSKWYWIQNLDASTNSVMLTIYERTLYIYIKACTNVLEMYGKWACIPHEFSITQ